MAQQGHLVVLQLVAASTFDHTVGYLSLHAEMQLASAQATPHARYFPVFGSLY